MRNLSLTSTGHDLNDAYASRRGSALIVTVLIVALLLGVAVTFTLQAQMSVKAATNNLEREIARGNARLAVELAIAKLQENVGADTNVTATASILGSGIQQPHLVGVWRSFKRDNADTSSLNYTTRKTADFREWLISANPSQVANQNSARSNFPDTVKMLDEGTVPSSGYVTAPIVSLDYDAANSRTNRYAWHVFDESQKANMTLGRHSTASDAENVAAMGSPGRPGFEALATHDANYTALTSLSDLEQEKLASLGTTALLRGFNPVGSGAFHTLSTESKNLLVDVASGGFKKDLSLLFAHDTLPSAYANRHIYSESDSPLVAAPSRFTGAEPIPSPDPTWSMLHSHYQLHEAVTSQAGALGIDSSDEERDTSTNFFNEQQLLPVISNAQFIFSMSGQTFNNLANPIYAGYLVCWTDIVLTLWNPHNVELRIPNMEVEFYRFPLRLEFYRQDSNGVYSAFSNEDVHVAHFATGNTSIDAADRFPTRARITSAFTLQPGEYKVFGPSSRTFYQRFRNYTEGLELEEGWDPFQGGVYSRGLAVNANGDGLNRWPEEGPGQGAVHVRIKDGDTYSVAVNPGKVNRDASFEETNDEEPVAYLKLFMGDGGSAVNVDESDIDDYEQQLNDTRVQVGAIEINMSNSDLNAALPSFSRNQMSEYIVSPTTRVNNQDASPYKTPFLIASLRLKTELDAVDGDNSAVWLHNGLANPYFTAGLSGDQDEDAHLHQYELTWEPMTSWYTTPSVEIASDNRGYGASGVTSATGVHSAPFLQVPLAPATSMAQFSHAPLNAGGQAPLTAQAVGNSIAPVTTPIAQSQAPGSLGTHLDHSYLANNTLFDGYFLSTADEGGPLATAPVRSPETIFNEFFNGTRPLANPSFEPATTVDPGIQLSDYDTVAQYLYYRGAFNVNSTSEDAWTLFLASGVKDPLPRLDMADATLGTVASSSEVPVSRFTPLIGEETDGNVDGERWNSHRRLSDTQIRDLASEIVAEVRTRGPFQSVAEFVNRRLESNTATASAGAIQTAIDRLGWNSNFGNAWTGGNSSDGSPAYITQADLLNRLAPSLTVRGDTFKIRAYGDTERFGRTTRAWCEVTVQREYGFVDASGNPDPSTPVGSLNATNQKFGREFKVVSFRWLSEDEV